MCSRASRCFVVMHQMKLGYTPYSTHYTARITLLCCDVLVDVSDVHVKIEWLSCAKERTVDLDWSTLADVLTQFITFAAVSDCTYQIGIDRTNLQRWLQGLCQSL